MASFDPVQGVVLRCALARCATPTARLVALIALALSSVERTALADAGEVFDEKKISSTTGNFGVGLNTTDEFGAAVAPLGDLDGDGVGDIVVGAPQDDDGGFAAGAVWILFMNADETVKSKQKINDTVGGFGGSLESQDDFGVSVAALGDLDGDGLTDIAVGADGSDDSIAGTSMSGAFWVLFLNANGTVKSEVKVNASTGNFKGVLATGDLFGTAISAIGDLDEDGIVDLAVSAPGDDDGGGGSRGAVWILFLDPAVSIVKSHQKISATQGSFGGVLDLGDFFGSSLAALGDLDGDGVNDLAVGTHRDDDGGTDKGAVWILFLLANGSVKSEQKISATAGGFAGPLVANDFFGWSTAAVGDLNGDGIIDLAVGALFDDDGVSQAGAVWILFLDTDGTVVSHQKISMIAGNFGGALDSIDHFGSALAAIGDVNGDGRRDLAVGAEADDDGSQNAGAVWLLYLDGAVTPGFDPPNEYVAAGAGDFLATGDLDSDGDEDAVIVIPGTNPLVNGHVQVFRNQGSDGTGGWLGFVANAVITVGKQPSGVAVGRFDEDTHLDIAVANAGDANVKIFHNTGAGNATFVFDQNITVGLAPQAIVAANLNGTGRDDLAVANSASDNVMIITNTTPLVGSTWMVSSTIAVGDEPVALEPEDVDNDKDLDLVVANRGSGTATFLFLNNAAPGTSQTVSVGGSPVDVAAGDIDDNGFSDVAVANESDDVVSLIPNNGGGNLGTPETVDVGVAPESVDLVDLDNDDDPDLAVVAEDPVVGSGVQVVENLGAGDDELAEFAPPVGYSVGADPNYVVSADVDEDGLTDLVTANTDPGGPTGGSVSVLLNVPCAGDHDSSGNVGFGDVTMLLVNWGPCPAAPANCPWDLDQNGVVGFSDLTLLLVQWGTCE